MNRVGCNCNGPGLGNINPCDDFVSGEIGTQFAANMLQTEQAATEQADMVKREQAAETLRKIAPILLALILRG